MKKTILALAATCMCVAPASALAVTTSPQPSSPVQLTLNSHFDWSRSYTPPVTTKTVFAKHTFYVATVSGTFSYYPARDYTTPKPPWPIVCGTPISSSAGRVGFDAEFIFARPWTSKSCRKHHLPMTWPNFQANTDSDDGWTHPTILGSWPTTPTPNHTYSYVLKGKNEPFQFRLWDVDTKDNYGALTITVRPATSSDCNEFWSFGFKSYASCATTLPSGGIPTPVAT
ncbi:MAG TPA: hypothetical protein VHW96_00755 [Solirubrobacteraceae bacterium]|jgi:hypothetical protein|nr:hypothetical protein [Solirubrobacteraceae bacterium]